MHIRICFCLLAVAAVTAIPARAQFEWTSSRPDGHAPIGVMGDHAHEQGEYMLAYRYMRMSMAGNRDGMSELTTESVLDRFMVAPLDMSMTMHMAGVMYAPTDAVTLMAMANWVDNVMNHQTRMGMNFDAESSGLGDASLGALIGLKSEGSTRVHLNAGLSLPFGSIEQTGVTPMSDGNAVQLPYPMQLGSGTWDVTPGITVLGMSEGWSWGFQGMGRLRMGENSRGYRQGHSAMGTAWFAFKPSDMLSLSVRGEWRLWGDYAGRDAAYMNPMMAPTVREDLRGGRRLDVPLGLNLYFPDGALAGHRLAVEWHLPVCQSLHGPQLESDWMLTVGWQKSFDPH